jgi:hypothetical protein
VYRSFKFYETTVYSLEELFHELQGLARESNARVNNNFHRNGNFGDISCFVNTSSYSRLWVLEYERVIGNSINVKNARGNSLDENVIACIAPSIITKSLPPPHVTELFCSCSEIYQLGKRVVSDNGTEEREERIAVWDEDHRLWRFDRRHHADLIHEVEQLKKQNKIIMDILIKNNWINETEEGGFE